ncbi:MAG: RNA polymerase factor sigma-54 [Butyricicoccus sp.]|nr:RNA polymerase factor sigma-54 [Butyricicoccus sp.]
MKLELSQKQGLTLAMQTSMHLLQLNNLQLRNYLGELMTSNPVVELEYPDIDYRPSPFERSSGARNAESSSSKEQLMEDRSDGISALNDLFLQSAALKLPPLQHRILNYLIQSLDANGFLTEPSHAIAHTFGVSEPEVRLCICLLQGMEPAGIGAADLKECLRLQLARSVQPDAIALQIVEHFLESMARQQYGAIAKALHVTKAQVLHACERIRSLNPKPLNGLGGDVMTQYILPDFYVLEDGDTLRCILNDYFLPKIQIDPTYHELVKNKVLNPADSEYIQKQYGQAQEIVKFLSYRKSTLQRVVESILVVQADFFHHGPGHRVALGNREIAQALSLHESTVSRAVSGKFFECKWGVFPLKSLFVRSTGSDAEPGSFDRILQRLEQLIASEPAGAAYSDQHLADRLAAEGMPIARRTVAKYRSSLGIPPASQRNAKSRSEHSL